MHDRNPTRSALIGAIAGLAGSWTMNLLMSAVARATAGDDAEDPQRNKREISRRVGEFQQRADPTGRVAEVISINVLKHRMSRREKQIAGPVVHYAFGALAGAAYAMAAESREDFAAGFGAAFGLGLWAAGDEIAVPALRLAPAPWKQPLANHAAMFSAHIIYGVTVEAVRRLLSRAA